MSITSDLRGYADTAVSTAVTQGKQFVGQAQAQLNDVSGSVNEFAGGLRAWGDTAEKALNVQALRAAVEPYLEQAKGYTSQLSERAEELFTKALDKGKSDPRVAKVLDAAESVASVVVGTVQTRVLKPLQGLRTGKPAARKSAPRPATKPATAQPTTKPVTTTPTPARASKPAAKTPRKSAVRKSTKSTKSTATS